MKETKKKTKAATKATMTTTTKKKKMMMTKKKKKQRGLVSTYRSFEGNGGSHVDLLDVPLQHLRDLVVPTKWDHKHPRERKRGRERN